MPLMTQIRERLATFFSIFAGVFVIYIVLDWGMDITGRKQSRMQIESQEIGKINERAITSKEFAEMFRKAVDNQKAQTGTEPDENQQQSIRDQIWQQLVEETLYDEQIAKLGIKITDQEIVDWVKGEQPPEFLTRQFTDSTGQFNRQAYDATIMDPKNKGIMIQIEELLRRQRQREKLQSIITASVNVSENDVYQKFSDQNIKYDADYAFFDPNTLIPDNEISVSDDDLRNYFNEHSEDYKVEATRKLKYVIFNEVPSTTDTNDVIAELQDIIKRAQAGVDFDTLKNMYNETNVTESFVAHGQMSAEKENALFQAKVGDIVGPVKDFDGFHLMKVTAFQPGKNEFIHASHILIKIENNDSAAAFAKAKNLFNDIKNGKNFAQIAKDNSQDPGSGSRGGDVGWFSKGKMVKQFETAAFKAKVGELLAPIKSDFGYHIIKVHARDNREVKFSDIHMQIRISSRTRTNISQQAQDFAYLAQEGDFEKEAQQSKLNVLETSSFQKDGGISGIGMNSTVNKFAFSNKVGTVSPLFSVTNGYGVFKITEVKEAGIRPFDEVKTVVESRLKRDKKLEKVKLIAAETRKSISQTDSLQKLSQMNPKINVQHLTSFSLSGYIPGIGRDLGFFGGISQLNTGDLSQPIESQRGVYLIKLINKSAFDSTVYTSQRPMLRNQLLSERRNRFFSQWIEQLKKNADIVDNRDKFYR
ncbi:MAG: peptidylprolyl isomerase [Ignavibacteriales bacterium]|nr:peptidylprolyl isomerase [Ignavibacteriales bacterium]